MISMENGIRTLNIASLGPESMRETATHQEIVKSLNKNKIQETHITQDKSYMVDNYRIITASGDKSEAAGIDTARTAIAIHENMKRQITQIARRSSREIRVPLERAGIENANSCNLNICAAQWAHRGRKTSDLGRFGRTTQKDMRKTPHHLGITRAWAARKQQPGRRKIRQQGICQSGNNRTYEKANWAERGNEAQLHIICRRQQTIPMTTWEKPKIARQDKWDQQQEDMEKENRCKKPGKYMTTWTSTGGNIRRKITVRSMLSTETRQGKHKAISTGMQT